MSVRNSGVSQSYTSWTADKWAGHESHLPSPCQPVSVSLAVCVCVFKSVCVCAWEKVGVWNRVKGSKTACTFCACTHSMDEKCVSLACLHKCNTLSCKFSYKRVHGCGFMCVWVCFYVIHLCDTGRIRALHHSLMSDSVTQCDPMFTWVSLDCGSLLSMLLCWGQVGDECEKKG